MLVVFYSETGKLAVKCADVNAAIENSGRSINVIADFDLLNQFAVVSREHVNVAALVAVDDAAIGDGTSAPDGRARLITPDEFTFVRRQRVHITVVRADQDATVGDDRT